MLKGSGLVIPARSMTASLKCIVASALKVRVPFSLLTATGETKSPRSARACLAAQR